MGAVTLGSAAIGIALAEASGREASAAAAKSVFIIFMAGFLCIPSPRCSRRLSLQLGRGAAAALNLGHETEGFRQSGQCDANAASSYAELIAEFRVLSLAQRWLATHEAIAALLQARELAAIAEARASLRMPNS
jgi:hypothetical protein